MNAEPLNIETLIPHSGAMSLLNKVVDWNEEYIECRATSHHSENNPLRSHHQLSAVHGIEYANQAIALHSRLLNALQPLSKQGVLASLKNVTIKQTRLDTLENELSISAFRLLTSHQGMMYRFAIVAGEIDVMDGSITVMLTS